MSGRCIVVGMRLVLRLLINALALWLTTLIVTGVKIVAYAPGGTLEFVLTLLLVAVIFGIVNGVIGNLIRIVAFPVYILTLGLISLIVNGLLLLLVAWISSLIGFGLVVNGFWWGVLGALVLGLIGWLIGILLRPIIGSPKSSR
ncbi:hypothetical protein BH11ACT4_BH11ACT4_09920 [soil metagenome]